MVKMAKVWHYRNTPNFIENYEVRKNSHMALKSPLTLAGTGGGMLPPHEFSEMAAKALGGSR